MAAKGLSFYLVKIVRISGWLLLLLMVAYLATGYALCGKYAFGRLIEAQQALTFHKMLDWPLIVLLLAHCLPSIYLAVRRSGWIRKTPRA